ncbi:MAG: hypothetical protein ABI378_07045, partial [Chitinophagaceae bacterium]
VYAISCLPLHQPASLKTAAPFHSSVRDILNPTPLGSCNKSDVARNNSFRLAGTMLSCPTSALKTISPAAVLFYHFHHSKGG